MENTRPYWKVIVSLAFSLIATTLFIVVGIELLLFFMPFVIGWVIASIVYPLVSWLEKRLKIERKFGSVLIIVLVLGAVVAAIYFGVGALVNEVRSLMVNFPKIYEELELGLQKSGDSLQGILDLLPKTIREDGIALIAGLGDTIGNWLSSMGEPAMEAAGNIAKRIPAIFIGTIVMIVSAYFFIAERDEVSSWVKKVMPRPIKERMGMVAANMKRAIGGYFKAQFKIMAVVGLILIIGLLFMRVPYAVLVAIVIAFLDFLPFFGTGTALWPWALYEVLVGNYKRAIFLAVLYGVTQLVRQVIQPKLVGDGVGLKPLPTLLFLYIGYKIGGIFGMILAVPVGMIVINMYQAGAFDYILDDAKILLKGILSLRK